ncbi:hypothetical protein Salat_0662700 [Sesamum alatum]|uniref:Uncharacterized protein n=1 Tax=Sesamum alatum TaxID=300844 RepID=A0AAE1YRT7_9LAMI|nr:hypothetical protein Salat_0662700 [Sesamum alatum]
MHSRMATDRISSLPCNHPLISQLLFTLDQFAHSYLVHGELRLPFAFRGFGRLATLDLVNVSMVVEDFKSFIFKCPILEYVTVQSFGPKAIGDLEIDAPNVKFFS